MAEKKDPNTNYNNYYEFLNKKNEDNEDIDINRLTDILEKNNYKSKTLAQNAHLIISIAIQNLDPHKRKKAKSLIGKKRSSTDDTKEDISKCSDEIKMRNILNNIINEIAINYIEFHNKLYKSDNNYQLNFTIKKNKIINYIHYKDILDKNLKEIILLGKENELEKESIKNKIETILKKEKKNNNLEFCNMLKMKIKDLILIYVNDSVYNFNNCKLKTLKDNTNYTEKEKEQIKEVVLNYINYPKESASNNSDNKFDIPQPSVNLIPLPNNDVKEYDDIKNAVSIENNKNQNIAKREVNQEKDEEQKFLEMKTKDTTDEIRGFQLEKFVWMTIEKIFYFVFNKIEEYLAKINRKIKKVYIDNPNNSIEEYQAFFDKKIIDILKKEKENGPLIENIKDDKNNSDELKIVKELLDMRFLDIINIFVKDETLNFTNGTKIKIDIDFENSINNNNQSSTSENMLENGNSYHNETPKPAKAPIFEIKNEDTKKKNYFLIKKENNQPRIDKQLIKESKNPEKGEELANMKRKTINRCFSSLLKMIEEIANKKLESVSINDVTNQNSAEKTNELFKKNIGEIVGRNNGIFVKTNKISEEIMCLKILFRIKFFYVVDYYIKDIPFTFTKSNRDKIELELFKDIDIELIKKNRITVKKKIIETLEAKGRIRASTKKKNDC